MPAIVANATSFKYTTDYPIDKVIYRTSGSESIPHASFVAEAVTITIPHDLGFRPLCRAVWSEDGFATYYEIGNDPWFFDATFGYWTQRIVTQITSDATNVYMTFLNWDTTRTLAYKIIGLAPTDMPASDITPAQGDGSFRFNTDYNYLKILDQGVETVTLGSFGSSTDLTVGHLLGYRPLALTWTEFDGKTYQSGTENVMGVSSANSTTHVTDTSLVTSIESSGAASVDVHYRIYLDETQ